MVSFMRIFSIISCYQWLACITIILNCIPQQGLCLGLTNNVKNIVSLIQSNSEESLISEFNDFNEVVASAADPRRKAREFIKRFTEEINQSFSLKLSTKDVFTHFRENIDAFAIQPELQGTLLLILDSLESNTPIVFYSNENEPNGLYWPNKWKWFGLNKNDKKKELIAMSSQSPAVNTELPGNCYAGACELLSGSLIVILPIPGARWLGGILIGDGIRRVTDGLIQLSDERRADPNFVPPRPPFR